MVRPPLQGLADDWRTVPWPSARTFITPPLRGWNPLRATPHVGNKNFPKNVRRALPVPMRLYTLVQSRGGAAREAREGAIIDNLVERQVRQPRACLVAAY